MLGTLGTMMIGPWARNFFECLIRDDWRDWVEAVRREMKGWDDNRAYSEIDFEDSDPAHPAVKHMPCHTESSSVRSHTHRHTPGSALT